MFLLDTDILSALRRRVRHPEAVAWLEAQRTVNLHLSVVTIGEIERGVAQQERRDPAFAQELARWLDRVLAWYGDRILPVNVLTARRWGQLSATLGHAGHAGADLLIAATALEHGLIVATRNVRHFEPTGVDVLNPFISDETAPK
jgi:predicted nucleic acid-binding protein